MADAIGRLGIKRGDRVATLGWNSYRHLELYSAIPCIGAIPHTLDIRLGDDDIAFLIDTASTSHADPPPGHPIRSTPQSHSLR